MKKLILKELILVSHLEKKARSIKFHPKVTVLLGENDVGKSSAIKSIYRTFGANPAKVNKSWKIANVTSCVIFTIDEKLYTLLRQGDLFALYNAEGSLLLKTLNVTSELGPYLAKLLDFNLILTSRDDQSVVPPPAYCFLPFYIDQDKGWTQTWSSFNNLGQFPNWRSDVIHYHSGIKPKEFYDKKSQRETVKLELNTVLIEQQATRAAFDNITKGYSSIAVDFDPVELEKRIATLLLKSEELYNSQTLSRQKLTDLVGRRSSLIDQAMITKSALAEFDKDYKYLQNHIEPKIQCPTCGVYHDNLFLNRFSLIDDRESCRRFLAEANIAIADLDKEITYERNRLNTVDDNVLQLQRLLEEKNEDFKLQDLIQSESEKRIAQMVNSRVAELEQLVEKHDSEIARLTREMEALTSSERKKSIESYYTELFTLNLNKLHVLTVDSASTKKIDCLINTTGSDQPRAILAYFFAYAHTLIKYSTSCIAPLIVDAPFQQEQDAANEQKISKFIFESAPDDTQLIVGLTNLHGANPAGDIIQLDEKFGLLKNAYYEGEALKIRKLEDSLL